LGMVLRMCRTEIPDRVSAWFIAAIRPRIGKDEVFVTDVFFYGNWMEEKYIPQLPKEARRFFHEFWKQRYKFPLKKEINISSSFRKWLSEQRGKVRAALWIPAPRETNMNSQFFNFVKTLIQSINKDTAEQLRIAEAVNRFVGCSFWALLISTILMSVSTIWLHNQSMEQWKLAFGVTVTYAFAIGGIVRHFRYLRNKEACMVFEASFAHRDAIKRLMKGSVPEL
jgi:hypothetical protein